MRYKTILIDADDTLLDFKRSEREAARETFAAFGIPSDDNTVALYSDINDRLWKLHERGGITKEELRTRRFDMLCEELGCSADSYDIARKYITTLEGKSYLIPGALKTVESLYGRSRLYLITNGFATVQKNRFGSSPLARYFDGVFISELIGHEKPSSFFFDAVKEAVPNFSSADTLVVGDSLTSDIAGGIGAGLDVCWLNMKGKAAPGGMAIDYIISDITELPAIAEGC